MKFIKQATQFPIINFDEVIGHGMKRSHKHSPLFPDSIRNITCGPSNSGKTNLLFNMIFNEKAGLKYLNVYIFCKSLAQEKYKFLEKVMKKTKVGFHTYADSEQVPHPNDVKPQSLMVFDDVSCEKQGHMRNYFAMGRHNGVDTLYLCQTYSTVPKQLVRDNANLIVLFKQDEMNMKHVFTDHVSPDMTFDKFKELCGKVWADDHGFVVICKDFPLDKGRYRMGFDTFVQIS